MYRQIIAALAVVTLAPVGMARADLSIDVSPVRFELQAEPGAEYTNAVQVQNNGTEPVRLRAYVEDWHLDQEGTPLFEPAGTTLASASAWLGFAPSDFLVEPGQTQVVRFTVLVPPRAVAHGYRAALLLESVPLNRAKPTGRLMQVRGRVACMLYITVGHPTLSAEITSLSVVARGDRPCLRMRVHNTGDAHFRLAGDVTCLLGESALGAPGKLPDVPVLPGTSRWVDIEIPEGGFAPEALARVTIDLADFGRLIGECMLEPARASMVH